MAIKDIMSRGIGFVPGSVKFIVTHGFGIGAVPDIPPDGAAKIVHNVRPGVPRVVNSALIPQVSRSSSISKIAK